MIHNGHPAPPHTSLRAMQVLDLLAETLRSGAPVVRSFALMPLSDASLRMDIVHNPRLTARINARLFGEESWVLPDHLDDFPQAEPLIALLKSGPSHLFRGLGFAWHGQKVARGLLSGDRELGARLSREDLRRVLMLRHRGSGDAEGDLPDDAAIDREGQLCLWSWMAALPRQIQSLGLAVLLKDCCVHAEYSALTEQARGKRIDLADAWLRAALPDVQVAR